MKNKITAMKSTLKGLKRIFELTEERISKPEDRAMKITKSEEPKKKTLEKEGILQCMNSEINSGTFI